MTNVIVVLNCPLTQCVIGATVAVNFSSGSWGDEIADVTESSEFQTCEIRVDWNPEVLDAYDYETNEIFPVSSEVNSLALEIIEFQSVIDNPESTPQEVSDATAGFILTVAELFNLLDVSGMPEVFVSDTPPTGMEGDLWVRPVDRFGVVFTLSNEWTLAPTFSTVYSGQARYIPVRAGVWQGGEAQLNATTIRAVRFQVPRSARSTRFHAGGIVTFTSASYNESLKGRTAKITDDFQGSTTATRTFHAMMDADSEDL